jgi:hypothetical protein
MYSNYKIGDHNKLCLCGYNYNHCIKSICRLVAIFDCSHLRYKFMLQLFKVAGQSILGSVNPCLFQSLV